MQLCIRQRLPRTSSLPFSAATILVSAIYNGCAYRAGMSRLKISSATISVRSRRNPHACSMYYRNVGSSVRRTAAARLMMIRSAVFKSVAVVTYFLSLVARIKSLQLKTTPRASQNSCNTPNHSHSCRMDLEISSGSVSPLGGGGPMEINDNGS